MNAKKLNRWHRAQEHERRFWNERGDVAEALAQRKPRYEIAFTRLAQLLPPDPVVVDVGSGPTGWARFLPGTKVYTDPLMESYRKRWRESLPEGHLLAAAGEALPLRNTSCDLVFSVNALDHCADPAAVLHECVRIVKPGGLLAISVYVHPPLRALLRRFREALGFASDPHPFSFTLRGMLRLLGKCGLEIIEVLQLGSASFRTKPRFFQRTEPLFVARVPVSSPNSPTRRASNT
ncbi:MAG: class I SAM-dependent methyltransferase [Candidatus Zipacnadales bacterium]